jgi:hypothetical protein
VFKENEVVILNVTLGYDYVEWKPIFQIT